MEGVVQFLQTYGLWIAVGGGFLFLMSRGGMGCCGVPQQRSTDPARAAADCHEQPAKEAVSPPTQRATTAAELQAELGELRARQESLARQVAALETAPSEADVTRPAVRRAARAAGPASDHRAS